MSIHYILDGYNVLKKIPEIEDRPLKDGRVGLINYLKLRRPQVSIKNFVSIVFDGRSEFKYKFIKSQNIELIFTKDETADDYIRRMVKNSDRPERVIVVTDDRELQESIKLLSGNVMPVKEFIRKIQVKPDSKIMRDKTNLTAEEQKKITDELKRIWLED